MKILKNLFLLTAAMAFIANTANAQQDACCDTTQAYDDCCSVSYMSAWIPVGALVVAGILIATTDHGHHHSSSSSSHAHFE